MRSATSRRGRPTVLACVVVDNDGRWGTTGPDHAHPQRTLNLGYMLGMVEARCANTGERLPGDVLTFRWWLKNGDLAVTNLLEIPNVGLEHAVGVPFSALYQMRQRGRGHQPPSTESPAEPPGM